MQFWWWFGLVSILGFIGYFSLQTAKWQRRLLDFQGDYHKTMDPLQIRRSRQTFFKSEIQKSRRLRRLNLMIQLIWGILIITLVLMVAQFLGMMIFSRHAKFWLTVTLATVTLAMAIKFALEHLIERRLYELTALAEDATIVDLSATPKHLGHHILQNRWWLTLGLVGLGGLLTIGNAQGVFFHELNYNLVTGWYTPNNRTGKAQPTISTRRVKKASSAQDLDSDESRTREPRVNRDPDYVRTLAPKSLSYMTTQDQVGLFAMYYLAYIQSPADGLVNNLGTKYQYHIIEGRKPLTIVVKSNSPSEPFEFMAEVDDQGPVEQQHMRLFKFTANTSTALNGLTPTYVEFPNSEVQIGQLINAYYSDQDGPYHRTMWAMEPGASWHLN